MVTKIDTPAGKVEIEIYPNSRKVGIRFERLNLRALDLEDLGFQGELLLEFDK